MREKNQVPAEHAISNSGIATWLVLAAFIITPFISTFRAVIRGFYGGDLIALEIPIQSTEIYKNLSIWFASSIIFIIYTLCAKDICAKITKFTIGTSNKFGIQIIIFALSITLFIMVAIFDIGTINRDQDSRIRILELAFALIQPYYIIILYLLLNSRNRPGLYFPTAILFLASVALSGFVGYLIYTLPVFISYFRTRNKFLVIFIFCASLLLAPIIRYAKYIWFSSNEVAYQFLDLSLDLYLTFADIAIDRFSFISEIIFIHSNSHYFLVANQASYLPVFQGYLGSFIHKSIFGTQVENINSLAAYNINGNPDWNSVFPLISYFDISAQFGAIAVLHVAMAVLIFTGISSLIFKNKDLLFVSIIPAYLLLFGGWFWPFANFLQALFLFSIIYFVFNGAQKIRK